MENSPISQTPIEIFLWLCPCSSSLQRRPSPQSQRSIPLFSECISAYFQNMFKRLLNFPNDLFPENFRFIHQNLWWPVTFSPYFRKMYTFLHIYWKILHSPYFRKIFTLPPILARFTYYLLHSSYWTPLAPTHEPNEWLSSLTLLQPVFIIHLPPRNPNALQFV